MSKTRDKNKALVKKTAFGAILSALAAVLLIIGGIFEILDMTASAIASLAVLVGYLEFGAPTAFAVYGVSSLLAFILNPMATSNIYYIFLLGYFPVFKLILARKIKGKRILKALIKFIVFNLGCTAILYFFIKLAGMETVIAEFSIGPLSPEIVVAVIFILLNGFLLLYDKLINILSVLYIKVFRKRIFPKG